MNIDGKMFERCNFACVELVGFMPLQRKEIRNELFLNKRRYFFSDEDVFNELTEREMSQHLNGIALSLEEQNRIKEDVKNLLDN